MSLCAPQMGHQMQACIQRSSRPRGSHDVTVVDEQNFGVNRHARIHCRQRRSVEPVGSRSAPVEQPGGGQNETTEAEADDNSAVRVGGPNRRQRFIRWSFASPAPAGQHDDGCLVQGVEAKRGMDN